MSTKKYLDYTGLSTYDQKIKEYIDDADNAIEGDVADLESEIENLIVISETEPSNPDNKIWVNSGDSANIQIPTMSDFYKALIKEQKSGEIVQFSDGSDGLIIPSLVVNLDYNSSGHTIVEAVHSTSNLFPKEFPSSTIKASFNENGTITSATNARVFAIPCKQNTDYIGHAAVQSGFTVGLSNSIPRVGDTLTYVASFSSSGSRPAFNSGSHKYIVFSVANTNVMQNNIGYYKFRINIGTNVKAFEAGDVNIITCDFTSLPDTIYGGYIDIVSGKMISTLDVNGDALATPVVYELGKNAIISRFGNNTIYGTTGDTAVEYYADTKLYINNIVNAS